MDIFITAEPLSGRFVTLQRIKGGSQYLIWREVTVDSTPTTLDGSDQVEMFIDTEFRQNSSAQLCPQSHPYAFNRGRHCCNSSMEASYVTYGIYYIILLLLYIIILLLILLLYNILYTVIYIYSIVFIEFNRLVCQFFFHFLERISYLIQNCVH